MVKGVVSRRLFTRGGVFNSFGLGEKKRGQHRLGGATTILHSCNGLVKGYLDFTFRLKGGGRELRYTTKSYNKGKIWEVTSWKRSIWGFGGGGKVLAIQGLSWEKLPVLRKLDQRASLPVEWSHLSKISLRGKGRGGLLLPLKGIWEVKSLTELF